MLSLYCFYCQNNLLYLWSWKRLFNNLNIVFKLESIFWFIKDFKTWKSAEQIIIIVFVSNVRQLLASSNVYCLYYLLNPQKRKPSPQALSLYVFKELSVNNENYLKHTVLTLSVVLFSLWKKALNHPLQISKISMTTTMTKLLPLLWRQGQNTQRV